MLPTVIITRPELQGLTFAQALRDDWHADLDIVLSPLLKIVPLPVAVPAVAGVVFTSSNGVAQAARLDLPVGIQAYCVGEKTAAAAAKAGFAAIAGPGNATDLIATIIAAAPEGPIVHIRGRHTRGKVAMSLTSAGIHCYDAVAYDQQIQPLTDAAKRMLDGEKPVVLPLFSPRSTAILSGQGPFAAPLHVVAISAATLPDFPMVTSRISDRPDASAMRAATISCLNAL